jgi:hypothetical protein
LLKTLNEDPTQVVFLNEDFLTKSKELLISIIKITPYPLRFKSCRLLLGETDTKVLILSNPWFFKELDDTEKNDHDFICKLLSINGYLIQYLSAVQKSNKTYIELAIKQNPSSCKYLNFNNIEWDTALFEEFVITNILSYDPRFIVYFEQHSSFRVFFEYALALDIKIIYDLCPNKSLYDSDEVIVEVAKHFEFYLSNETLASGMIQDSKLFYCDNIDYSLRNILFAIENGFSTNWEEEFNKWDNNIILIEAVFANYPSEFSYGYLKNTLKSNFHESKYINADIIGKCPNLYLEISEELQNDPSIAKQFVKNLNLFIIDDVKKTKGTAKKAAKKLDNTNESGVQYLHKNFKTDLNFLLSLSNLELDFELLTSFFDNTILHNEQFILNYLVINYDQYEYFPQNLKINKNIALQYGKCKIENIEYYKDVLTDLSLPDELSIDKDLIIDIAKSNLNNNHKINEALIKDESFLLNIIKYQPLLVKSIDENGLSTTLILKLLNSNINVSDYLDIDILLTPEVFKFICNNDIKKLANIESGNNIESLISVLKENINLSSCINFFNDENISNEILKYHKTDVIVLNNFKQFKSDIGTLFYVNGYCTFTLGYNRNCYVSEDVAGVISDETITDTLNSDESWSSFIWENSWYDFDNIYHKYGIIEPATDLQLPDGGIISINLNYEMPLYDKFDYCFNDSNEGDFIQIASSDEKAYGWDKWKKYTLEVKPGIFNINNIEVEFEHDIVSGYSYKNPNGNYDNFEEDSDYSTSGKGFSSSLYFNNGIKLVSVDVEELREALNNANVDYSNTDEVKEFTLNYYKNHS